jgi:hypothetical protein
MKHRPAVVAVVAFAALTACSEDPDPVDPASQLPPAAGATITAQGWPVGTTGVVRLFRNPAWEAPLGEFAIDANGQFSYALGVPDELLAITAAPGLAVSAPDARFQVVTVAMTLLAGDAGPTGELRIGNRLFELGPVAGDTLGELFYVDRDVTITGNADGCAWNLRFREGWNYALMHVITSDPFSCVHTSSPGLPDGLGWHYVYLGP